MDWNLSWSLYRSPLRTPISQGRLAGRLQLMAPPDAPPRPHFVLWPRIPQLHVCLNRQRRGAARSNGNDGLPTLPSGRDYHADNLLPLSVEEASTSPLPCASSVYLR